MKSICSYSVSLYFSPLQKFLSFKMFSRSNIPRSKPSIFVSSMSNYTNIAHIEKTFESLGKIAKIEQKECSNYKQAIVHFQYWYENSDADSARSVLLNSKELLVMHKLNKYWSTMGVNQLDDTRPYSIRRMDDRLCEYDVSQGFKDRRISKRLPIAPSLQIVAQGLKEVEVEEEPQTDEPQTYEYNRHTFDSIKDTDAQEYEDKIRSEHWFIGDGRINGNLNYGPYVEPPKRRKITIV